MKNKKLLLLLCLIIKYKILTGQENQPTQANIQQPSTQPQKGHVAAMIAKFSQPSQPPKQVTPRPQNLPPTPPVITIQPIQQPASPAPMINKPPQIQIAPAQMQPGYVSTMVKQFSQPPQSQIQAPPQVTAPKPILPPQPKPILPPQPKPGIQKTEIKNDIPRPKAYYIQQAKQAAQKLESEKIEKPKETTQPIQETIPPVEKISFLTKVKAALGFKQAQEQIELAKKSNAQRQSYRQFQLLQKRQAAKKEAEDFFNKKSIYEILGLDKTACNQEVIKAYNLFLFKIDPAKASSDKKIIAEEFYKKFKEKYPSAEYILKYFTQEKKDPNIEINKKEIDNSIEN